jgi:hypothetical protein
VVEFAVAVPGGVNWKVDNLGVGWILVLGSVGTCAIHNELYVVFVMEDLGGYLVFVAEDEPAAHTVRASELVDLHKCGWLSTFRRGPCRWVGAFSVCPGLWVRGLG